MNQWQLVGNVTNEKGRQVGEPARVNLFWAVESWASEYLPPRTLVVVCNRSTNLVIKKNICSRASLRFAGQKKSKSTNTRCRKVKEAKWSVHEVFVWNRKARRQSNKTLQASNIFQRERQLIILLPLSKTPRYRVLGMLRDSKSICWSKSNMDIWKS